MNLINIDDLESFSIAPNAPDALTSLEDLVARMDQAMTATLPNPYEGSELSKTHKPVINAQVKMKSALAEAQAAAGFLCGGWTPNGARAARAALMECCTCVIKAAKLTQHLLKQRMKKVANPVLDQVTSDKRPAPPSGSPTASPKRRKIAPLAETEVKAEQSLGPYIGDSEPDNETTKPDQSMEPAKSPTPPSAHTPPTGAVEEPTMKSEPDVAMGSLERDEKIQRLAEIRARAARDAEAVWARAKAEIEEITRREQKEIEELL